MSIRILTERLRETSAALLEREIRRFSWKGRGLPVGTTRVWGDKKYKKERDGSWSYVGPAKPGAAPAASAPTSEPAAPAKEPTKEPAKPAEPAKAAPVGGGGKIKKLLGKTWHTLAHPFKQAYKIATNKEARDEFKGFIKKAVKKEAAETKHLMRVLKDAVSGKKVSKEDRTKAINQTVDLAKTALIGGFVAHLAAAGIGKLLATLASPADEVAGTLLDGPIRRATKKIFGHAHGILPSGFYGDEKAALAPAHEWKDQLDEIFGLGKKKATKDEHALLDQLLDALMDELAKEGFTDEDIEAALTKTGMTTAQATALARELEKIAKKR